MSENTVTGFLNMLEKSSPDKDPVPDNAFGCMVTFLIVGLTVTFSIKGCSTTTETPAQTDTVTFNTPANELNKLNDAKLNHYLKDYSRLCTEFKRNACLYFVNDVMWGSMDNKSKEKLFGSRICIDYEYSRVTGKKGNQTLGDYYKLLQQYQRDSINARHRQLRGQNRRY